MSAVEVARGGIARMIATGELESGQILPSEAELCERFGVSRSSLREAQKMLTVAGVLSSSRGGRPTVSDMSPEKIMSGLSMVVPLLPLNRFLELYDLREVLEGHVAALAAARLSDADCIRLVYMAQELTDTEPGDRAQIVDAEFHELIIRGAGDDVITTLLKVIRRRGRDYRIFEMGDGLDLKAVSDAAHLNMARAIRERDPETARSLAMQHVRATKDWLKGMQPGPIVFAEEELRAASATRA